MNVPHTGSAVSLLLLGAIVQVCLIAIPLITLGAWYIHTPHRKLFLNRLPYAPKLQVTIRGLTIGRIAGLVVGIPATLILLLNMRNAYLYYAAPFIVYACISILTLIIHGFTFRAAHVPGHSGLERRTLTQYTGHLPKTLLVSAPLILLMLTLLYPFVPVVPDNQGTVYYAPVAPALGVVVALLLATSLTAAIIWVVILRPRNSSDAELVSLDNIVRRRSINELIFGLTAAASASALGLSVRGAHYVFAALFLRPTVFINTSALPSSALLIILAAIHSVATIANIVIFVIALARQFNPGIGVDR
ncbi:hypothetical protein [Arcanobacterium phocae]|uniref:hypothetical protein n=1 Tax=Arcanobacterium phocae TaxID=131112 RepID=UPI001C0EDB68|nr:hypothetical protein [Arcanobacterium phocae]